MNKIITILIGTAIISTFSNCTKNGITGSGPIIAETRTVGSFNSVTLDGSADVNIIKGDSLKVVVRGFQNLVPLFTTTLQGNTLVLKYQDNTSISNNDNIIIDVTMPVYNNITLNGSGDINVNSSFNNLDRVIYNIDGSGDIIANNSIANFVTATLNGSGNIYTFGVNADSIYAVLDGSGDIDLSPNLYLNAKLTGSGEITYDTNPTIFKTIDGSGSIKKK
jgi:hypothetical protein